MAVSDSNLSLSDQDPKSDNSTPESSEWRCNSDLVHRDSEYCCSASNMQRLRYYFAAPAVAVRHANLALTSFGADEDRPTACSTLPTDHGDGRSALGYLEPQIVQKPKWVLPGLVVPFHIVVLFACHLGQARRHLVAVSISRLFKIGSEHLARKYSCSWSCRPTPGKAAV